MFFLCVWWVGGGHTLVSEVFLHGGVGFLFCVSVTFRYLMGSLGCHSAPREKNKAQRSKYMCML